ncbi:uncharacterized protein LOC134440113 isoform X2 [Engraulis encrasicolus]|uniref:uncharacterized protein LOC134440113 isoform X2 n=1 Tax=Engraulis encrasicolus TaxID=184585 RepID=UPI002FD3EAAF
MYMPAAADSDDWDFFSRTTKEVCPGQPTSIPGPGPTPADKEYDLYFKSHLPGSYDVQITDANGTLNPYYVLKKRSFFSGLRVDIPEVMSHQVGVYHWKGHRFPMFHMFKTTEIILKDCSVHQELSYGTAFKMVIPIQATKLEFTPSGSKDQRILWSRTNADFANGEGGTTEGHVWLANEIRFADAGLYTFRRESGGEISSMTVKVTESERFHDLSESDSWEERLAVPVSEAVVTFVDSQKRKHVIFKNRMVTQDALKIFGGRLSVTAKPDALQLNMKNANSGTVGRYEVTVKEGRAFVIHVSDGDDEDDADDGLSFEDPMVQWLLGIAANILLVTLFCCVARRCCKGLKSALPPAEGVDCPVVERPTPAPRPDPAYQPGARSQVESSPTAPCYDGPPPARSQVESSPTAPCYDGPPPSYEALMGNVQSWWARGPVPMCPPYTPLSPDSPPEARAGAGADAAEPAAAPSTAAPPAKDGAPPAAPAASPTPTASSIPSAPDYQYQPGGLSGTTGDFLSGSPLNTDTSDTTVYVSDKLDI